MSTMHEFDPNYPRPIDTPKFTPGPWGIAIGKRTSVVQLGVTGPAVAVCSYDNGPIERANARLIAAAPELYQSLLEMVEDSDDVDDKKLPKIPSATLTRARQALAKAVQS